MVAIRSLNLISFLSSLIWTAVLAHPQKNVCTHARITALGLSPSTIVATPQDAEFANQIARYTSYDSPTYCASVEPATYADVQKIVKFATRNSLPFLATGGGHGFSTTLRNLRNSIQIDLRQFKSIKVDKTAQTVTVGGAVLFGELIPVVYEAGFEMTTGSEHCVGLVGATLGGGIGRLNGMHGMLVDALQSVKLVTASGKLLTVSAESHSDLFWGIRGAGMNFGIVVEATYKVSPLTPGGIMNADFLFPVNSTHTVFEYLKQMNDKTLPAELSIILQVGYNPSLGGTYVVVNAAYMGPQSAGLPLIQGLIDAGPIMQNISQTNWGDQFNTAFFSTTKIDGPCAKGAIHDVYGVGIKSYDVPTLDAFFANLSALYTEQPKTQNSTFFIEAFPNQAAKAVPNDSTAYPHRDITTHLLFNYQLSDMSVADTVNEFAKTAREAFAKKSGFGELRDCVNYGHGDEGPVPLYTSGKLPRLRSEGRVQLQSASVLVEVGRCERLIAGWLEDSFRYFLLNFEALEPPLIQ